MPDAAADRYTHGHHPSVVAQHARRTAEADAAYLLPRLRPGMRLLDVGCGPGSITLGLARAVDPGGVVGVDLEPSIVEQARQGALEAGLEQLRFEPADAYALPFEAGSFDVVHAHQVLQHLARPVEALREWRRTLRSGGLVAVRDADYGTMTHWPPSPRLDHFFELYAEVTGRNGADANAGRRLVAWATEAGFIDLEVTASTVVFATPEAVGNWGLSWAERAGHSSVATQAVEYGLATAGDLERIAEGWRDWASERDAFFMYVNVEVLGRAP